MAKIIHLILYKLLTRWYRGSWFCLTGNNEFCLFIHCYSQYNLALYVTIVFNGQPSEIFNPAPCLCWKPVALPCCSIFLSARVCLRDDSVATSTVSLCRTYSSYVLQRSSSSSPMRSYQTERTEMVRSGIDD